MNFLNKPQAPEQSDELTKRIRLVRRDFSDLLFHFTRRTPDKPAMWVLERMLGVAGEAATHITT